MKDFYKKISRLIILSLVFVTTPSYSDTKLVESYVVIVGGGTSGSALPPLEEKFKSSNLSKLVSLPNNSILTLESKDISGLNPGFHIAVLGFCTQKERAESLRDVAKQTFPGSYIKKVHVDSSQIICPSLQTDGDMSKESYYVEEEEGLVVLPVDARLAVLDSLGDLTEECKPKGKKEERCALSGFAIKLDESGKHTGYLVIPQEGSLWAASAAPIWIVSQDEGVYRVLLSHVTYGIYLLNSTTNGLKDIKTERGTAALSEWELWQYNGDQYIITENYSGDPR